MNNVTRGILLAGCVTSFVAHAHNGIDHAKYEDAGNMLPKSAPKPSALRGGVVHEIHGIHYELISAEGNLSLYLFKQGKPLDVKSMAAVATLISGNRKEDVRLVPTDANRLEAKLKTPLPSNATVLINVAKPGHSAVRIQFVLKQD